MSPCIDCPAGAKLNSSYPDEEGRPKRLCSTHAKIRGTHKTQHPCTDCPAGAKLDAHHPDNEGRPNKLCSAHAKAAGTHKIRNPCTDCPAGAKLYANYPDEEGRPGRLCSAHAKAAGTHKAQNPCTDCPENDKLESHFRDEHGSPNKLCARHAFLRGLIPRPQAGASKVACEVWDRLNGQGWQIQHVHFTNGADVTTGREFKVPGPRKYRLDGYDEERNTGFEFMGNAWHGYPPDHPKRHERSSALKRLNSVLYKETMLRLASIYDSMPGGFKLYYIWEHEFQKIRNKSLADMSQLLNEFGPA